MCLVCGHGNTVLNKREDYWREFNLEFVELEGSKDGYLQAHQIDKVAEFVKNGGYCIVCTENNFFKTGGHYMTVVGISEDGTRLIIHNSDKTKYNNNDKLSKYLEEGFPIDELYGVSNTEYYCYEKIDKSETEMQLTSDPKYKEVTMNRTTEELLNEVLNATSGKSSNNVENATTTNKTGTSDATSNKNTGSKDKTETTQVGNKYDKVDINDSSRDNSAFAQLARDNEKKAEKPQDTLPQTGASNRTSGYDQNNYADTPYAGGTVASEGCGITCVAEYLTRTGQQKTPDELAKEFSGSASNNQKRMLNALDAYEVERGEWNNGGGKQNMVREALENGKSVLVQMNNNSIFTYGEHFIILEGMTDDGKVLVYDPNGDNKKVQRAGKEEGYKTGFDIDDVMKGLGGGCVLEKNINE